MLSKHPWDVAGDVRLGSHSAVMANVLASEQVSPSLLSPHLPPFSQQLEDMFISTQPGLSIGNVSQQHLNNMFLKHH